MANVKKLGKGMEDISHLFLSSEENPTRGAESVSGEQDKQTTSVLEIPTKSICLTADTLDFQNVFLIMNLSLALARLGMRIAIADLDEKFPCLNFFFGKEMEKVKLDKPQDLIKDGPLGVKLIGLNQSVLKSWQSGTDKQSLIALFSKIEENVDLILVSVSQRSLLKINPHFFKAIKEFLFLVPKDRNKMLCAYKSMKTIFHYHPLAKIGAVVVDINHMYEVDFVYGKMAHAVEKFLDKELYKFGFLFKINQELYKQANFMSFYDADLTACISNIAQIVILRSNLIENAMSTQGSIFEKIINNLTAD